jgi:type II secretory pathway component PulM
MEKENLEFFKLDEIDRKVLLWLLEHVPQKSVIAWLEYIATQYRQEKSIQIDIDKVYTEVESLGNQKPNERVLT